MRGYALFLSLSLVPVYSQTKTDFLRDVQPIFESRCQACHGAQQQVSGLRLEQKEAALKGGTSGKDIIPGNSAGSRLIRLVSGMESKIMPPMGAPLTAADFAFAYGAPEGPRAFVSTIKLRQAGFTRTIDTEDSFRNALQSLIDNKLLPPASK